MKQLRQIHSMMGWRGTAWLAAGMAFSMVYSGIELLFAYFLAHLLFLLQVSGSDPASPPLLPLFFQTKAGSLPFLLLIGSVRVLLRIGATQSITFVTEIVRSRLRFVLFQRIYDFQLPRISQSEINTWLAEIFPRTTEFTTAGGNLLTSALQVGFFFAVMLANSPLKALAGSAALLVLGPVVGLTHRHVRNLSRQVLDSVTEMQRRLIRVSRNWLLIRLLRTEDMERRHLCAISMSTSQKNLRIELLNGVSGGLPELASVAVVATLIGLQYGPDRQAGPAFVAFLYLFMRFAQALVQVGAQTGMLQANYPRFQKSAELISKVSRNDLNSAVSPLRQLNIFGDSHPAASEVGHTDSSGPELSVAAPRVVFEGVSFSYPVGPNVVTDLSFEAPAGSAFGVIGPSGIGKSTVLALLMGIEVPDRGRIRLIAAGQEFDPVARQVSIGYVGPEPFLFPGTVADNLSYGSRSAIPKPVMISALKKAGFSGDDYDLEALLGSLITEDGEGLSTGEKQRLCLARALLVRPALLVLDEVSANLDLATEAKIAETVSNLRGSSTIVIVSHREGMLEPCDRVLDLRIPLPCFD